MELHRVQREEGNSWPQVRSLPLVQKQPERWIHLASVMKAPLIFREAIIHLVSRYRIKDGVDFAANGLPLY